MKITNNIKTFNEDCRETLKRIPDKSIQLILEDMPYSVTKLEWDKSVNLKEYWELRLPKLKDNGCFVLTGTQPFTTDLISSNRKMFKYEWIWQKNMASNFLNAKIQPLKVHENVLIFYKNQPIYNPQKIKIQPYMRTQNNAETTKIFKIRGEKSKNFKGSNIKGLGNPHSILKIDIDKERHNSVIKKDWHPSRKSLNLFRYLIKTYTNKGDTVFDGYLGSGTTALACEIEQRKFIGSELNKEYFESGAKRLKNHIAQLKLDL